ncbi:hypothetical protein [Vibrio ziniensis]|uniref:Uncharacterized protein n=1 Tax=Vibrio ziniensis TaxID=2711221 RepID=A0A6G7CJK6_9VIBR|nr:hypothetical protein [Vibrio ziniensis]QIH42264.1 hypothetical protein G5S32_09750 [Vibrio ziniensis]
MQIKASVVALGLTSTLALYGCGGGGDSSSTSPSATSYSVKAIDGYLQNAFVWLDVNGNYEWDEDEPSATTGVGGAATLDTTGIESPESYMLIVQVTAGETIDEDTGLAVTRSMPMYAPPGVPQVTPLTTYLQKSISQGMTESEALAAVAEEFDIEVDDILSDYKAEGSESKLAAFVAKSLVSSGLMPATIEELNNSENDLSSTLAVVAATIKTQVTAAKENSTEDELDAVYVDGDGLVYTDTDGDGTKDEEDAFPEDPTETMDTDGDGHGDNSDAFPNNAAEWLDTDKDGYGDNSDAFPNDPAEWLDSDGDTYGDNSDAFPNNATEWLDTDADGYGDNSDAFPENASEWLDTDADGYGDNSDAFPSDASEWLDTDGDKIGNNADTDDDGDGVLDVDDADPTDPDIGSTDTVAIVEYLSSQTTLYSPWVDEDDNDTSRIFVDTLSVSGDTVTMTGTTMLKANKTEGSVDNNDTDLVLTSNGWSSQTGYWQIDMSGSSLIAYPTDYSDITYTLNGSLTELTGQVIADTEFEWEDYSDVTATFPAESYILKMTLTPNQDHYYLWDWEPYVAQLNHEGQQGAASLDELIFATSTVSSSVDLEGMSIGSDIFVKFVGNSGDVSGSAEYYSVDWTDGTVSLDGEGEWTRSSDNGVDMIEFSVPDATASTWGESFDEPTNDMIVSVYEGAVYIGNKETEGELLKDDSVVIISTAAKEALIDVAELPLFKCSAGDSEEGATVTTDDYATAISDCYGATAITAEMVEGQNFHRVRSAGGTRDYMFNSDGSLDVYKDGEYGYLANWVIENGQVKITYDGSDDVSYWALIDYTADQWNVKWYEDYVDDEVGAVTEIWSSTLTLQDLNACSITESSGSYADYQAQISAYETCIGSSLPTITESDVLGAHLVRINSSGQTRAYVYAEDNMMYYYKNGIIRSRNWQVNEDSMIENYYDGDTQPHEYLTLIKDATSGEPLTFAVYDVEESDIWIAKYTDVQDNADIGECTYATNEWDDDANIPLPFTSYSDFSSALATCLEESGSSAKFSNDFMLSDLPRVMTSKSIVTGDDAGETESYTFNADLSGTYDYEYPGDEPESYPFTWSIDDETGRLTVVITVTDTETEQTFTFTDYIYMVDTDGIEFSLKIWSHSDAWDEEYGTEQGDSWSGIYTFSK